MAQVQDKVVLITGASGGLGNFVTQAFLDGGAKVVGVSRKIAPSDFPHPGFTAMPAELTGGEAAEALADAVVERFGRVDALVHVMGGFAGGVTVAETADDALEKMLSLNFRSAFHMIRAVVRRMSGGGSIVAIGSRAAIEPMAKVAAYSASKAALISLVRSVALEFGNAGISANVIVPGTMDTPANRASSPGADYSKWVDPAQVAALAVWLASGAASQVNGAVIPMYERAG